MVKRTYDLYPRIHDFANLYAAHRNAARGKRGRPDIAAFEYHLEDHLLTLRDELRANTYRPDPYRRHPNRSHSGMRLPGRQSSAAALDNRLDTW